MNDLGRYNCVSIYVELRTTKTRVELVPAIHRAKFIQLFYVTNINECGIICDLLDKNDCYTNVQDDKETSETKITPLPEHLLLGFGKNINDCPIFRINEKHKDIIEEINFKVVTVRGRNFQSPFNIIAGLRVFQKREKMIAWPRAKYKTLYIEIRSKNTKARVDPPIYGAKFVQMFYMTNSKENGIFCDLVDETNSYSNIEQNKITNETELRLSSFIGFGKSYDYPLLEIEKSKGEKIEEINIGISDKEGSRRSMINMIVGLKIFH